MTHPKVPFDAGRLRDLTSAAIDGSASEIELEQLTSLLRSDERACDEYLAMIDLHSNLATDLAGPAEAGPAEADSATRNDDEEQKHAVTQSKSSRVWSAAILGIGLAASVLFMILRTGPEEAFAPETTFASLVHVSDASWDGDGPPLGTRLGNESLRLTSGIAQVVFDSGVEVTLQGPAIYHLVGAAKTRLVSGLLTATVPEGAEGFSVDTPNAEVVDLGTSFGIDLRLDGVSEVSVFEGGVDVILNESTEKRRLDEGDAIRIRSGADIEDVDLEVQRYAQIWPVAMGVIDSSDSVHLIPPWPKRVRFIRSDDQIFLAAEGRPLRLEDNLSVNVAQPGEYRASSELTPSDLQRGTRVRSYLLQHAPERSLPPREATRVSGTVTFDQPIVGLIVLHDELLDSSHLFGNLGAGEPQPRRQLDFTGKANGDRITLSEDRRTLQVNLISPGRTSDLIRVIVEAPRAKQRRRGRMR